MIVEQKIKESTNEEMRHHSVDEMRYSTPELTYKRIKYALDMATKPVSIDA